MFCLVWLPEDCDHPPGGEADEEGARDGMPEKCSHAEDKMFFLECRLKKKEIKTQELR